MTHAKAPSPVVLLPHRGAMLLLDEITMVDRQASEALAVVEKGCPFLGADGTLLPSALLEMVAQTAAAHMGYEGYHKKTAPPKGYLVGVRDMMFKGRVIKPGDVIAIRAELFRNIGEFAWYKGEARLEGELLCKGTITVYKERG